MLRQVNQVRFPPSDHDEKTCVILAEMKEDRMSGYPTYRVRFEDGVEGIAREDELYEDSELSYV